MNDWFGRHPSRLWATDLERKAARRRPAKSRQKRNLALLLKDDVSECARGPKDPGPQLKTKVEPARSFSAAVIVFPVGRLRVTPTGTYFIFEVLLPERVRDPKRREEAHVPAMDLKSASGVDRPWACVL